jgi:hypothetical protein
MILTALILIVLHSSEPDCFVGIPLDEEDEIVDLLDEMMDSSEDEEALYLNTSDNLLSSS